MRLSSLKTLFADHKQKKHKRNKTRKEKISHEPIKRNRNKNPKTMERTKEK